MHITEKHVNDRGAKLIQDGYDYGGRYPKGFNSALDAALTIKSKVPTSHSFVIATMDDDNAYFVYFKRT